jgi:curved DNA-binding protein CbpA
MFKDYYQILGIEYPSNPVEIKGAYHLQSMKWHPDKNPGRDTKQQMQDVNEAYNILKDDISKGHYDKEYLTFKQVIAVRKPEPKQQESSYSYNDRYDYDYDYDIQDEDLRDDVNEAREAARNYVNEFFSALRENSKAAASGAWEEMKVYVYIGIIGTIIYILIMLFG